MAGITVLTITSWMTFENLANLCEAQISYL